MGRKIIYVFLVLASLGGYVMFDGAVLLAAACFLVLLAAVLLTSLQLQKRQCRMTAADGKNTAEQGERAEASFQIFNQSILPVTRASVQFQFSDSRVPSETEKRTTNVEIKGKSKLQLSCKVSSEHSGVRTVRVKRIVLYDFLQIFSCRLPVPEPVELYILPPVRQLDLVIKVQPGDGSAEEEDDTRKGEDPSVTYQIREYQPGDSMRGIHWKLSARTDRWMVREYGTTVSRVRMLLRLEYRPSEMDAAQRDGYCAAAASLIGTFCRSGTECDVVWEEGEGERRFAVTSEEDLCEIFMALVKSDGPGPGRKEKRDSQRFYGYEKELCLDGERRLWEGTRCVAEFPESVSDSKKWQTLRIEL